MNIAEYIKINSTYLGSLRGIRQLCIETVREVSGQIMFSCPNCSLSVFPTLKVLLRHIHLLHADQECFTIRCDFQGCSRTFTNLRSFENHIYTYHDITSHGEEVVELNLSSSNNIVDDHDNSIYIYRLLLNLTINLTH